MPKYQIAAGVVSAPEGAFYTGTEVTAKDLGIPKERFDHLVEQGAIAEVKGEQSAQADAAPPAPPANEPPANDTKIVP